jgi:3D (Asp-Asp-Asp) domain-containing protein
MKRVAITISFSFLFATSIFAREESLLARITVYWPGEGQLRACSNGARLRAGHCAVDPKRIPFGSRVLFPDATCIAVDSGPDVVTRKAARSCGRTASQRNAIVIDRFFESRREALSWASAHPQFMTVWVSRPGSESGEKKTPTSASVAPPAPARAASDVKPPPASPSVVPKVDMPTPDCTLPNAPFLRFARRRA